MASLPASSTTRSFRRGLVSHAWPAVLRCQITNTALADGMTQFATELVRSTGTFSPLPCAQHAFSFETLARLKWGSVNIRYRTVECQPIDVITVRVDQFRPTTGKAMHGGCVQGSCPTAAQPRLLLPLAWAL